jgi:hypothetical protein
VPVTYGTGNQAHVSKLDQAVWRTVPGERVVLVVARTPAALNRLLDVLPALSGDPRVEIVFTVDPHSRFSAGLGERLAAAGARLVDWDDAVRGHFDLALAASDNTDLHLLDAPLLLLPHGVGYQRYAPHEPGAISGLRRSTLVRDKRIVPSTLVVAHPDQVDTVRAVEPRLVAHTMVAGDPCLDRIAASSRRRDRYRAAFDAGDRELVVLCSTWGPHSLFGRHPGLPARVVGELETDRYRVALTLHPNVWTWHGALQLRAWLRPALDAGLILIPPDEGWRAALVAADVVVSDHGSLTCYAAATGVPVVLAEDGGPEVVPDSPIDRLRGLLPALRHDEPIGEQLTGREPAPDVADTIFANRGHAVNLLRTAVYRELRLPPPPGPARVHPVPVPDLPVPAPTVLSVHASMTGNRLTLQRFPVVDLDDDDDQERHLVANESEVDPGWVELAAVVWRAEPHPSTESALSWATATLAQFPGARVAVTRAAAGETLAMIRDGGTVIAVGEPSIVGSAVFACVVRGIGLDRETRLDLTGSATISLRPR